MSWWVNKLSTVAVFTIATNKYYKFWENMLESADKHLFLHDELSFYVFTNIEVDVVELNKKLKRVKVFVHNIPDLVWPYATLERYKYIAEYGMGIQADYFAHIDADMFIVPHLSLPIEKLMKNKSITLVAHPGFWRVAFPEKIFFYGRNLRYILRDFKLVLEYGHLGTWSKNRKSKAFVTRSKRKQYYCGAFWFGKKDNILKLAEQLRDYTEQDLRNSSIPEWNDESYLNYWGSNQDHNTLTPSFCYEESYKNLIYLNPAVVALDKKKYD
jgi:hypothetical protein